MPWYVYRGKEKIKFKEIGNLWRTATPNVNIELTEECGKRMGFELVEPKEKKLDADAEEKILAVKEANKQVEAKPKLKPSFVKKVKSKGRPKKK
jgi:hypothetical protein